MKENTHRGFTLIELILYLAISALLLLGVSTFLVIILGSRTKGQVVTEVEQQGWEVSQVITQTIRNSLSVNYPVIGYSSSSLSLAVATTSSNPIIFDLKGGSLRITEGAGGPITLTNDRVGVTSLVFENLARSGTKDLIRFKLTISYLNPANKAEFNYSKNFYGSAQRR